MSINDLLNLYERAWDSKTTIFGVPGGQLSAPEAAGELIKNHGLDQARRIADQRAREFPASWNQWRQISDILDAVGRR